MSGTLQVEWNQMDRDLYQLVKALENAKEYVKLVRQYENFEAIDWKNLLDNVNARYDVVLDNLMFTDDDATLDEIEGEEEVDTEMHPLDPENDEWHEGFDDA